MLQSGLGLLDEARERRPVTDGDIGQDLAVELDAGELQPCINRP